MDASAILGNYEPDSCIPAIDEHVGAGTLVTINLSM